MIAIVSYIVIILLNVAMSNRFFVFRKYEGQQCWGVGTDVLRDFVGDEEACKEKCKELNCVGFIRVNSGSRFAGKCYFRGDGLQDPYDYNNDNRDCYRTGIIIIINLYFIFTSDHTLNLFSGI